MIAKCIKETHGVVKGRNYAVLGGTYSESRGQVIFKSVLIEIDSGALVEYDAECFDIKKEHIDRYVFNPQDNKFMFDLIAYPEFLSMLYEDRTDFSVDYIKAKNDLKSAKYFIYNEYSYKDLEERLCGDNADETDFVFSFLKEKQDDRFIETAVGIIKNAIARNEKAYNVVCAFEYLAAFRNAYTGEFFNDCIVNEYWDDDVIKDIIYGYEW